MAELEMSVDRGETLLCGGVAIEAITLSQGVERLLEMATEGTSGGVAIHLCNAYTISLVDTVPGLRESLESGVNFPDGLGVVWANMIRYGRRRAPAAAVRGPDLFLETLNSGQVHHVRHYLLGSTDEVLMALREKLLLRFPDLKIVGVESPEFRPLSQVELQEQSSRIRKSGAQIVWVALGTPKQNLFATELARHLSLPLVGVGAAFDFAAGAKREAPRWIQRSGMEWFYRFVQEPRRLFKRYFVGHAVFIWRALTRPISE